LTSTAHENLQARYQATADAAIHIAKIWLGVEPGSQPTRHVLGVAYCAYLHTITLYDFSEYEQILLADSVKDHFFHSLYDDDYDD
jgi:hypothetical protein